MTCNFASAVEQISKELEAQDGARQGLRKLCLMRVPIELLREFKIQELVKKVINHPISPEIFNLAMMVDARIQKLEDFESEKQKKTDELSSKAQLEELLSSKRTNPSKIVPKRKNSSSSSSSSSSTSPARINKPVFKPHRPSKNEIQMQEENRQKRLTREAEKKKADEANREANKAAFAKAREDRKRAMQMEKETKWTTSNRSKRRRRAMENVHFIVITECLFL
uniref:NPH3 domain-containing protein n=1 Tax=Caenorhabditis tropicalis TaxID=1561998 RepID=A0A1I7T7L0_9PELO